MSSPADNLPHSPACERNKSAIVEQLARIFVAPGVVLEIGSCTGQHAQHFARHLPHVTWQPSDVADNLAGLEARRAHHSLENLREAIELDVRTGPWPVEVLAGIFAANVTHIMDWTAVQALFAAAANLLPTGDLVIYGPFNDAGRFTSEGNRALDAWARQTFPGGGLRDLQAIATAAEDAGFEQPIVTLMPANNLLLHFVPAGQSQP